ncbi:NAD(P)H-hydrate dehydratase [Candidatus Pacearchaeota archaeon]|nr:NAD(P)H-hydrate dehydratase [Candidatus Pacearchaeota archaeon]MBD3283256.1 NAD(P)H-hydrate dehydratase [Candidatus Pacearchaeota archaeon]
MIIRKSIIKKIYKKRDKDSKKGDFGKLVIIGGSKKYTGAPALNALAALASLKTGVDIVEVVAPERAADIVAGFSHDLITYPLSGDSLSSRHLKVLLKESEDKNAFVMGGGLGKTRSTINTVRAYLKKIHLPGVIDADAISAIDKKLNLEDFVITPHAGEFRAFAGVTASRDMKERIKQVQKAAKKFNTTILLKGPVDIISDSRKTAVNKTGNSYMTVGGTGDVLAGILGGLLAQGSDNFQASCAAAYISGKAAEISKKKISLTGSDILKNIEKIVG